MTIDDLPHAGSVRAFATQILRARDADGCETLLGPWRAPVNLLRAQSYGDHASIHDDATAQRLGFRGGTIEGPTHFSQFAPLLEAAFGADWFVSGFISANYRQAAYEGERVQASLTIKAPGRGELVMTKEDGSVVLTGQGGLAPGGGQTGVREKRARARSLAAPRILEGCIVGAQTPPRRVRLGFDQHMGDLYPFTLADKLAVITEPSPWYTRATGAPWGRAMMPLEMVSVLCQSVADQDPFPVRQPVVGLFADQEIVVSHGPLSPDDAYDLVREVTALSETPKTECVWIESRLYDPGTQRLRATMLLNQAFLKSSSDLYAGEA